MKRVKSKESEVKSKAAKAQQSYYAIKMKLAKKLSVIYRDLLAIEKVFHSEFCSSGNNEYLGTIIEERKNVHKWLDSLMTSDVEILKGQITPKTQTFKEYATMFDNQGRIIEKIFLGKTEK